MGILTIKKQNLKSLMTDMTDDKLKFHSPQNIVMLYCLIAM